MEYIKETNAFYDWLETNSIAPSSICLWHALMSIANKTRWQTEFSVAISVLTIKTGLKKDAIENARLQLAQKGRIEFRSRGGNKSAMYKIIPFVAFKPSQDTAQTPSQHTAQDTAQTPSQHTAINKLDKTRLDDKKDIKKTKAKKDFILSDFLITFDFSEELKNAITSFAEFRESIKKPFTERALKIMLNQLEEWSYTESQKIQCINNSIMNGWQGVFKLKDNTVDFINKPAYQTKAEKSYQAIIEWASE